MKVLLWKRFVGGPLAEQQATSAILMVEHPVRIAQTVYAKRRLCICEQRILALCDERMSTASACKALTRGLMNNHPDATDEEPEPGDDWKVILGG